MADPSDKQHKAGEGVARAKADRRGRDRVDDDQKSGQGSQSALSKMKMIERKRAPLRAVRESDI